LIIEACLFECRIGPPPDGLVCSYFDRMSSPHLLQGPSEPRRVCGFSLLWS
jgi:hypothetical protein